MSKEQFEMMRFQEMESLYSPDFSKKEAIATGKKLIKEAFNDGEVNKLHLIANLARMHEVLSSAMSEARESIIDIEKCKELGVEFIPVQGGETLNYKDDPVWVDIKKELTEREELLKLAYKSKKEIYDSEGIEVTKVSSTPKKSSIQIKF